MEPRWEHCPLRRYAERRPSSLGGKIWSWHIKWCPGWKTYQESLAKR